MEEDAWEDKLVNEVRTSNEVNILFAYLTDLNDLLCGVINVSKVLDNHDQICLSCLTL